LSFINQPISFSENDSAYSLQPLPLVRVVGEVRRFADIPEPSAGAVIQWCIRAAQYKRSLFPFVSAEALDEHTVRLEWTGINSDDLYQRWTTRYHYAHGVAGRAATAF
jgi:hypothetical protein